MEYGITPVPPEFNPFPRLPAKRHRHNQHHVPLPCNALDFNHAEESQPLGLCYYFQEQRIYDAVIFSINELEDVPSTL